MAPNELELLETIAMAIYDSFDFTEKKGEKPSWFKGGNSTKQDEARRYARAAMRATANYLSERY